MTTDDVRNAVLEHRKAGLILEGEIFRARIIEARATVIQDFRPGNLMHCAAGHAADLAGAGLQSMLSLDGSSLRALLPFATTAVSFLSRKKLLMPAIGAALGAAAVIALGKRARR